MPSSWSPWWSTTGFRAPACHAVAGLGWAVAIGSLTTALAYVAWYASQRSMSATTAGTVQLAIPVLTTLGAVLLLGEKLTAGFLLAALLVAAGRYVGSPRLTTSTALPQQPDQPGPPPTSPGTTT